MPFPPISFPLQVSRIDPTLMPSARLSTHHILFDLNLLNSAYTPATTFIHPTLIAHSGPHVTFHTSIPNGYHQPLVAHQFQTLDQGTQLLLLKWDFYFPKFSSEDPHVWLHRCEEFFLFHGTPDHIKSARWDLITKRRPHDGSTTSAWRPQLTPGQNFALSSFFILTLEAVVPDKWPTSLASD